MPSFHVISLFPEFFASPLATSLLARAQVRNLIDFTFHNPRDHSVDKHHRVDDSPYGGGPGMVMRVQPVADALRAIPQPGRIICLSPSGLPLTATLAASLASERNITLICGRYEGIDSRLCDIFPIQEISVGNAVLNGGETAALAVIEAVSRFVPGFLGKDESATEESFANGLLEYPQYTRPETIDGLSVPSVLRNGNHAHISRWRRQQSLARTLRLRPQMLEDASLTRQDAEYLGQITRLCPGRNLSFCLFHYPVRLEKHRIGASSLTNLDVHDIARISRSYGMGSFYVLTPLEDQLGLLRKILAHWLAGGDTDRSRALQLVRPVLNFEEMEADAVKTHGIRPVYVAASAQWQQTRCATKVVCAGNVRAMLATGPVVICLGTARGLAPEVMAECDAVLRPLRFLSDNHLSVRSAAAIIADRVLGDFC